MTLLEKIKALLAKAASTDNAAEAEAFAAKAAELMDKYQIDIDQLGEAGDAIGEDTGYTTKERKPVWQNYVASATARYYGCDTVLSTRWDGTKTQFIGRESARMTAMEMLPYFIQTINRLARDMVAEDKARGIRSYQRATAHRIGLEFANRLGELTPDRPKAATAAGGNALILLDQQRAWLAEHYPNLKTGKARSFSSSTRHRDAAASIGLARQTAAGRSALRIGG